MLRDCFSFVHTRGAANSEGEGLRKR